MLLPISHVNHQLCLSAIIPISHHAYQLSCLAANTPIDHHANLPINNHTYLQSCLSAIMHHDHHQTWAKMDFLATKTDQTIFLRPLFRPNKYKYTKMKTNNIKQYQFIHLSEAPKTILRKSSRS